MIISPEIDSLIPQQKTILARQGVPESQVIKPKITDAIEQAIEIYRTTANPAVKFKLISMEEFSAILIGENNNAPTLPIENIYTRSKRLHLYAATLGNVICEKIKLLHEEGEFVISMMLDTIASCATENSISCLEQYILDESSDSLSLSQHPGSNFELSSLSYSPGYCGWHISGQKKLFSWLDTTDIAITLNDSFLMMPVKSASGVVITGNNNIHQFKNKYPFCKSCISISCRERMVDAIKQQRSL